MPSITVFCPGWKNSDDQCETEIELECEVEPADPNYGADADGNRGIYVGPHIVRPDPPKSCSVCNNTYDKDQLKDLERQIEQECCDYSYEPDEPERED